MGYYNPDDPDKYRDKYGRVVRAPYSPPVDSSEDDRPYHILDKFLPKEPERKSTNNEYDNGKYFTEETPTQYPSSKGKSYSILDKYLPASMQETTKYDPNKSAHDSIVNYTNQLNNSGVKVPAPDTAKVKKRNYLQRLLDGITAPLMAVENARKDHYDETKGTHWYTGLKDGYDAGISSLIHGKANADDLTYNKHVVEMMKKSSDPSVRAKAENMWKQFDPLGGDLAKASPMFKMYSPFVDLADKAGHAVIGDKIMNNIEHGVNNVIHYNTGDLINGIVDEGKSLGLISNGVHDKLNPNTEGHMKTRKALGEFNSDLVHDVLLDPLTYVGGIGAATKVVSKGSEALKAAEVIGDVEKTKQIIRESQGTKNILDMIPEGMSPEEGVRFANNKLTKQAEYLQNETAKKLGYVDKNYKGVTVAGKTVLSPETLAKIGDFGNIGNIIGKDINIGKLANLPMYALNPMAGIRDTVGTGFKVLENTPGVNKLTDLAKEHLSANKYQAYLQAAKDHPEDAIRIMANKNGIKQSLINRSNNVINAVKNARNIFKNTKGENQADLFNRAEVYGSGDISREITKEEYMKKNPLASHEEAEILMNVRNEKRREMISLEDEVKKAQSLGITPENLPDLQKKYLTLKQTIQRIDDKPMMDSTDFADHLAEYFHDIPLSEIEEKIPANLTSDPIKARTMTLDEVTNELNKTLDPDTAYKYAQRIKQAADDTVNKLNQMNPDLHYVGDYFDTPVNNVNKSVDNLSDDSYGENITKHVNDSKMEHDSLVNEHYDGEIGNQNYLYHGTPRDIGQYVDEDGNLHINASSNFGGKQYGVSFSEDPDTASYYASMVKGEPTYSNKVNSKVIRINRNSLNESRLSKEAEEEVMHDSNVVVPKGQWNWSHAGDKAEKELSDKIDKMSHKEFVNFAYMKIISGDSDIGYETPNLIWEKLNSMYKQNKISSKEYEWISGGYTPEEMGITLEDLKKSNRSVDNAPNSFGLEHDNYTRKIPVEQTQEFQNAFNEFKTQNSYGKNIYNRAIKAFTDKQGDLNDSEKLKYFVDNFKQNEEQEALSAFKRTFGAEGFNPNRTENMYSGIEKKSNPIEKLAKNDNPEIDYSKSVDNTNNVSNKSMDLSSQNKSLTGQTPEHKSVYEKLHSDLGLELTPQMRAQYESMPTKDSLDELANKTGAVTSHINSESGKKIYVQNTIDDVIDMLNAKSKNRKAFSVADHQVLDKLKQVDNPIEGIDKYSSSNEYLNNLANYTHTRVNAKKGSTIGQRNLDIAMKELEASKGINEFARNPKYPKISNEEAQYIADGMINSYPEAKWISSKENSGKITAAIQYMKPEDIEQLKKEISNHNNMPLEFKQIENHDKLRGAVQGVDSISENSGKADSEITDLPNYVTQKTEANSFDKSNYAEQNKLKHDVQSIGEEFKSRGFANLPEILDQYDFQTAASYVENQRLQLGITNTTGDMISDEAAHMSRESLYKEAEQNSQLIAIQNIKASNPLSPKQIAYKNSLLKDMKINNPLMYDKITKNGTIYTNGELQNLIERSKQNLGIPSDIANSNSYKQLLNSDIKNRTNGLYKVLKSLPEDAIDDIALVKGKTDALYKMLKNRYFTPEQYNKIKEGISNLSKEMELKYGLKDNIAKKMDNGFEFDDEIVRELSNSPLYKFIDKNGNRVNIEKGAEPEKIDALVQGMNRLQEVNPEALNNTTDVSLKNNPVAGSNIGDYKSGDYNVVIDSNLNAMKIDTVLNHETAHSLNKQSPWHTQRFNSVLKDEISNLDYDKSMQFSDLLRRADIGTGEGNLAKGEIGAYTSKVPKNKQALEQHSMFSQLAFHKDASIAAEAKVLFPNSLDSFNKSLTKMSTDEVKNLIPKEYPLRDELVNRLGKTKEVLDYFNHKSVERYGELSKTTEEMGKLMEDPDALSKWFDENIPMADEVRHHPAYIKAEQNVYKDITTPWNEGISGKAQESIQLVKDEFKRMGIEEGMFTDQEYSEVLKHMNYMFHTWDKKFTKQAEKEYGTPIEKLLGNTPKDLTTPLNKLDFGSRKVNGTAKEINQSITKRINEIRVAKGLPLLDTPVTAVDNIMSRVYLKRSIQHENFMFHKENFDRTINLFGETIKKAADFDTPEGYAIYREQLQKKFDSGEYITFKIDPKYEKTPVKIINNQTIEDGYNAQNVLRTAQRGDSAEGILSNVGSQLSDMTLNSPFIVIDPRAIQSTELYEKMNDINYIMPKHAYNNYTNFMNAEFKQNTTILGKMFDKGTGGFKALATSYNPSFHINNSIGNTFNSILGIGMNILDPKLNLSALKVTLGKGTAYGKTAEQWLDMAYKSGAINPEGAYGKVDKDYMAMNTEKMYKENRGLEVLKKVAQSPKALGTGIENQARLSNFMYHVNSGKSIEEAADLTNKFLFDYGDLTKFEQKWMHRAIPFYTWMRKNLPLQFEMMATKPEVYSKVNAITNTVNKPESDDLKRFKPDNLDNSLHLGGGKYLNLNLPYKDVTRLNLKDMVTSTNPLLKTPAEEFFNKNIYFDSPIAKYAGEKTSTPGYVSALDKLVERLGINTGVVTKTPNGDMMDTKERYALKSFLPAVESSSNAIKSLMGYGTPAEESKTMGWMTGVKTSTVDVDKAKQQALYDYLEKLKNTISEAKNDGTYKAIEKKPTKPKTTYSILDKYLTK